MQQPGSPGDQRRFGDICIHQKTEMRYRTDIVDCIGDHSFRRLVIELQAQLIPRQAHI